MTYKPPAHVLDPESINGNSTSDHRCGHIVQRQSVDGEWTDLRGQGSQAGENTARDVYGQQLKLFPGDKLRIIRRDEWRQWLKSFHVIFPRVETSAHLKDWDVTYRVSAENAEIAARVMTSMRLPVHVTRADG